MDPSVIPITHSDYLPFLFHVFSRYYTKALSIKDVQSVWAGLRPLVRDPVAAAKGITGTKVRIFPFSTPFFSTPDQHTSIYFFPNPILVVLA